MLPSAEIRELSIRDYLEIIRKHLWLILSIVVALTGFTVFHDFSSPKIYLTKATLIIETERPNITGKVEEVYEREMRDKDYLQTQINILQSKSLAERVVKKLNLEREREFRGNPDIAATLLSMLKVEAPRAGSTVVISVKGKDPVKIAAIANTWVREFIYQDVEKKVGTAKYGISFLEQQMAETLTKLRDAEKELNDFIRVNRIVTIPDIETKTEALLENLKLQKAQLEKDLAEASQKYKEKHPKLISLSSQLKAVDNKINDETNTRLTLQEKMSEYGVLKRKVETYKYIYDDFLKRAKELDVSKELTISNIRILDRAEEPKSPVKPNPSQDIPVALLISFVSGVFISLFLEKLDSTLKTSDDVEFYAKLPFLGYIPYLGKDAAKEGITLICHSDPRSRMAESFRNLKVSLLFSFPQDKPLRTIVITSSIPGEGKSFISANLSIIFAQANEPTLLIDSDMRKGNLNQSFNLKPKSGLSSLLAGMSSLDEAIIASGIPNLWILSAGPYAPNPTELLSSEKLPQLFRELEQKFKRVIIDSTPILNVSEALILGDKCDGIVFVVRANQTALRYITEAKKVIGEKVKVIGGVLNSVEMERGHYYYYHYYYPSPKEHA